MRAWSFPAASQSSASVAISNSPGGPSWGPPNGRAGAAGLPRKDDPAVGAGRRPEGGSVRAESGVAGDRSRRAAEAPVTHPGPVRQQEVKLHAGGVAACDLDVQAATT